jgi:hypothetical protein
MLKLFDNAEAIRNGSSWVVRGVAGLRGLNGAGTDSNKGGYIAAHGADCGGC